MNKFKKVTLAQILPYLIIAASIVGLIASFALSVDKIHILKDPSYSPPCNINPLFSCASVMNSSQSDIGPIPNTFFGILAFGALLTVGVAMLAGAKFKRWFWRLFYAGVLAGLASVAWLIYQSLFVLGTLCVFCMSVWVVVIMLWWYTSLYAIEQRILKLPEKLQPAAAFARAQHGNILALIYIAITVLIVWRFWYFFGS